MVVSSYMVLACLLLGSKRGVTVLLTTITIDRVHTKGVMQQHAS